MSRAPHSRSPCRSAGRRESGARNRRSRSTDRPIRACRRSYMKPSPLRGISIAARGRRDAIAVRGRRDAIAARGGRDAIAVRGGRDAIAARGSPCRSAGRRESGARNRRSRSTDRLIRACRRSYMKPSLLRGISIAARGRRDAIPARGRRDAIAARGSPCRSAGRRESGARNRRSRPADRPIRACRRSYMKPIRCQ